MNALPTKEYLHKRRIIQENFCAFCSGGVETVEHVLRYCSKSPRIWFSSLLGFRVYNARNIVWVEWIANLAKSLAKESFDLVLLLIWNIWKDRNELIWQGLLRHPIYIHCKSQA